MKKLILVLGSMFLVGCAVHPDNIEPIVTDYRPAKVSCTVLSEEYNVLRKTEISLYKELKDNYNHDIAMVATSIITLPVFFPSGTEDELVRVYSETMYKLQVLKKTLDSHCVLVK